ncbi:DNA -binding domain-containing protein [Aestuariibius insulae]|uniref:DNA -binding domain-containing protein n=1 Tax=Aestuariibius insulae TaxID=2058287 RepID=UPI00345E6A82
MPCRRDLGVDGGLALDLGQRAALYRVLFAEDGLHILVTNTGVPPPLRLFLPLCRRLPKQDARFGIYIQPDLYLRERCDAALRLQRHLGTQPRSNGRSRGLDWPQRNHARLAAMLFAMDLAVAGLGQRAIARQVMRIVPGPDWATSPERSALRRLLRDGARYVASDYRELLHPPKRPGRG